MFLKSKKYFYKINNTQNLQFSNLKLTCESYII